MLLDLPPMDVDRVCISPTGAGGLILAQLLQDAANLREAVPLPLPVEEDGDYHGLLESRVLNTFTAKAYMVAC